jgi:outer membrane scaffolding protein for murein synthesis (MipA/OmpV family)
MRHLIWAAVAASISSPLLAQTQPTAGALPSAEEIAGKDMVTVAGGVAVVPDYEGSDDYRIIPAAAIRGKVSGISFTTRGSYLYVDVVPGNGKVDFDAGPIVGARFSSRRHIDDDIVKLLPNRKTTVEVGGFAGVSFHGLTNPYDSLGIRLDVLHGLGSGRNWTNFSPNVEFSTPFSRTTYVSASVGAEWAANKYADYYFSISPADSLRTGDVLPAFNADGGLKNWKAGLLLNQSITGDLLHGFSVFGTGEYSRLVGDFKRSPIVSQRGSASQWIGALGLAYTW